MKNQNPVFIAIVFALAFALAPVTNAAPNPGGIPDPKPATHQPSLDGEQLPVISIHSGGNIPRGKTGSFVLEMKPALAFGGMYVNFKVGGTAVAGVDYVAFLSPAYIGESGYAVISFATLRDPRAGSSRQAYSVVVTVESGLGYALGEQKSALIWIKPAL
jgi:hypothetical protein